MTVRFINNEPALLIADKTYGRMLVIADLHLGIENELYRDGIIIAPQSEKLFLSLTRLVKMTKANHLIIVGDFRHKIPGISFRELKEIPKFIQPLSEMIDVTIVKGNHDTEMDGLLPKTIEFVEADGLKIGPYGFFHGHAWPDKGLLKCDYLFTSHIHPTVEFVDDFGFRIVEKVWLKGKLKEKVLREKYKIGKKADFEFGNMETVIIPSFNPIVSGIPINSRTRKKKGYIGALLRSGAFDVKEAESYLLDGTNLGNVNKIR